MNRIEQGVRQRKEVRYLLIYFLLLTISCLAFTVSAETLPAVEPTHNMHARKHHVLIIHSPDNKLQSAIVDSLSKNLYRNLDNILVTRIPADEKIPAVDRNTNLIIGIGETGIKSAHKYYPKANKLYIATSPKKRDPEIVLNKHAAILYMTQSLCRNIHFIDLINEDWNTISLLSSKNTPVDKRRLKRCAKKYGKKIYTVDTYQEGNLSADIKDALDNSDVLLALPDKNIYNSNTVKNILLTSYRHRKPVIAFSENFVNAGALASVNSNTEQIGKSASKLIKNYFEDGLQFKDTINYPQSFGINVNRQVFKALELPVPNTKIIRRKLANKNADASGLKK